MEQEESPDQDLLDAQDIAAIDSLTESDIKQIDEWLLSCVEENWRKVAMVVAKAISISDEKGKFLEVPDVFFGMRVESLVASGRLVAQGDLKRMRLSEVKRAV